jgi:glycosyltransferase involved in cell wall biosynthesis
MNINFSTPIGYTGYGYVGLNILKALYSSNNTDNIGLMPMGHPSVDTDEDSIWIKKYIDNVLNLPYDTPAVKIWHQNDLLTRPGNGKYFAFPFFEIDKLPNKDIFHLNFPDDIIVSCDWAKQVLLNNQVSPNIHVVPLGVDRSIFNSELNQLVQPQQNYIFCTIGKWEKRKAHDKIIECFNNAFNHNDNVELWMLTHNQFFNQEQEQNWIQLTSNSKLSNKIKIFPRLPSHADVAKVISYTDCGIYISRAEGWNMELLETMAMNKPVIASNYSAHTEYCNSKNSYLVDMNEMEPAIDYHWFYGDGNWGKITQKEIDQTVDYMRYVYSNNIKTNEAGLETAKTLSWQKTADKILEIVSE